MMMLIILCNDYYEIFKVQVMDEYHGSQSTVNGAGVFREMDAMKHCTALHSRLMYCTDCRPQCQIAACVATGSPAARDVIGFPDRRLCKPCTLKPEVCAPMRYAHTLTRGGSQNAE
jgi:hypothetical protein